MQTLTDLDNKNWFFYLSDPQKLLFQTVAKLLAQAKNSDQLLADYSYLIFPAAKAYEGFLKNFLLDLNLVSERACYDKHFRIGRSLNPDVRQNQRDEFWLYDDVSRKCGKEVARLLWEAWLKCRNQVFHYFPDKPQLLNLETAISRLKLLEEAMEAAVNCLKQSNL